MAMNEFGAGFILTATDHASRIFGSVGRNFSLMAKKAEGDSRKLQSGLMRIGKGMALIATGFGMTKPLHIAVTESSALNQALAEVTTLTDEATFPLGRMKELTKDLASGYGQDAQLQAKALYQTISAGYGDAAEASKLMTQANKLAVGGVTDVTSAVDGLTNVMNTYSAAELEASDVSDAMFVAMKEGKTTIGELSNFIGRAAPGAEALGIKFDELFASIAAITSKGINTSQTVSGIAGAMANITKPTADATDEAKRLGIEFSAAALRSKGLKGFLDSITESAKFNDDTISKLFGSIEAFKVMTALTSNDSKKFNDVLAKMADRAGATDAAVSKMENTFAHQAARTRQVTKNFMASIGDTVEEIAAPILKGINNTIGKIAAIFESLPPGAKKTIVGITGAIGGLVAMTGAVMVLSGAMKMLGISVFGMVGAFAKMLLIGAPLLLLVGGLGMAAYAAYKAFRRNTGGITDSWGDMVKKIKLGWGGILSIIKGESDFPKEIGDQLMLSENKGVRNFLDGFYRMVQKAKALWSGIVKGFETGVDRLSESSSLKKLRRMIESVISMFTGEGRDTDPAVLKEWEQKGASTGERLAQLGEIALDAVAKMVDFGKEFAKLIGGITADDVNDAINTTVSTFRTLWDVLKGIADALVLIYKIGSTVVNGIQLLGAGLGDIFGFVGASISLKGDVDEAMKSGDPRAIRAALGRQQEFMKGPHMQGTEEQWKDLVNLWSEEEPGMQAGLPQRRRAEKTGVVWERKMETREDLVGARESILQWMNASTKEWREKHPESKSFGEMPVMERAKYEAELQRLERMIKEMSSRPIRVEIDGEAVANSVRNSDSSKGVRDLDESFGF